MWTGTDRQAMLDLLRCCWLDLGQGEVFSLLSSPGSKN